MTGAVLMSNISSICCDPAVPWWGVALYNWPQKLKSGGNTRDHCSWGTFVPQIQFGLTRVFLSPPRYDWCAPLSHPSCCMLVNHGPSQQSSKEEYKPLKWGATAECYTSPVAPLLADVSLQVTVQSIFHIETAASDPRPHPRLRI